MSDPVSFTAKSARFNLPFIFAGQAQKEFFVNQGLALTDSLLQPAIEGELSDPPQAPTDGECWLIGTSPSGEWQGHEGALACRQAGSWVLVPPSEGMAVYDRAAKQQIRFTDSWNRAAEPAPATGGSTVDAEARAMLLNVVEILRIAGTLPAV